MSTSASSPKPGAIIFLHGLGDTPMGWMSLEDTLPSMQPRLGQLEYVFPAAPTIPITINGGMSMPGWFDLYDWPIGVGSKDDPKGLQEGVEIVQQHVEALNAKGIPTNKIVVGGFSQGGAIALLAAYRKFSKEGDLAGENEENQPTFAGCVGLSAWLTMPKDLVVPKAASTSTPMYWGHGTLDDKVLYEQQHFGVTKLREQGVTVIDESYRMGHSSDQAELRAMAAFVDKQIFGEEKLKEDL